MDVEIRIEELALTGLPPADPERLGSAIQDHLARLIGERGVPPSMSRDGVVAEVSGGTLDLRAGASAEEIGSQVARAVYEGLSL